MSVDQGAGERRAIPPMPTAPPAVPARDWWDELYGQAEPEPVPGGGRLPDWRKPKPDLAAPAAEPEPDSTARTTEAAVAEPEGQADQEPDDEGQAEPEPEDAPAAERQPVPPGAWLQPHPGYYPALPNVPAAVQQAPAALSPKTRLFIYNASAAGAGWWLGLLGQFRHVLAECGTDAGVGPALILGIGGTLLIAHVWDRRTRHWWIGLAWGARIPLATAIVALGLYAPGTTF
ncbi:hypothetical protein [Streptomyces sp. NPDC093109]|uniref:hypothetical protein n=1 Tax=Streptomyces sp. NPDC093109 TaxID=3154977 RepID=UPI00344BD3B5